MDFEIKDGIYLSFVEVRNVHCDNLSFEEKTGILKRKYKLFHRRLGGGVYCFSVFSKTKTAEHNFFTFVDDDFDCMSKKYLKEDISFINLNDCEFLSEKDLLFKIKDISNKFMKIAKIKELKYAQLVIMINEMRVSSMDGYRKMKLATGVWSPDGLSEIALKRLGLA